MLIKKLSIFGKENEMEIPVDPEKFKSWDSQSRMERRPVQDVFPELSKEHREFLISGLTPEEWDRMFAH